MQRANKNCEQPFERIVSQMMADFLDHNFHTIMLGLAGHRVHVRPLSTRLGCPGDGTTGTVLCQDTGLDPGEDLGVGPRQDAEAGRGADPGEGPGLDPRAGQPGLEAPPSAAPRGRSAAAPA